MRVIPTGAAGFFLRSVFERRPRSGGILATPILIQVGVSM